MKYKFNVLIKMVDTKKDFGLGPGILMQAEIVVTAPKGASEDKINLSAARKAQDLINENFIAIVTEK